MDKIIIKIIDKEHESDINIKNEPFQLFGYMIPKYQEGKWDYTTVYNDKIEWDCFPDENYDFDKMKENYVFIGAYVDWDCIGLAILEHQWNKYIYLYDLKVNSAYRNRSVGKQLIEACYAYAREHGYRGVWTIGQNNNLGACLFYVNNGFQIGGLNTEVYRGTNQEGKSDIYFFKEKDSSI